MTPVTFQRLLNRHSRLYHDKPAQLRMKSIIVIGRKGWRNWLTISWWLIRKLWWSVDLEKNCTPLVW